MIQHVVRVLLILGMAVVTCGMVSAAGMGIIAETHVTSGMDAPVCTAPCQCMAESTAIAQWGVNGYEMCSKTICGQSADAMVQYHCIHQLGSSEGASAATPAATQAMAQAPASAAIPAAPVAGVTQKSPVNASTILAAIGVAFLAAAGMRSK
jgi:hypothetical protein